MNEISLENAICRLCLSVCKILNELVQDDEIIKKVWNCFSIKINIDDEFPNAVCVSCTNKVNEMYDFQCKVRKTDELLHKQSCKGSEELNKFYSTLKDTKIKEEINTLHGNKDPNLSLILTKIDIKLENANNSPESDNVNNSEDDTDSIKTDPQTNSEVVSDHVKINTTSKNNGPSIYASQFKCLTCFELFETRNELLLHYNKDHFLKLKTGNVDGNYETITMDENVTFKCNLCFKEYNNKRAVVRHILLTHFNERPFICKLCGRTFKTVSDIIRHDRVHDDRRLFCSHMCGYSTVYTGALKEHEKRHNKTDYKYKCEKCGKGFHVKTWYEQHENVHTGAKPFVCDICGAAFHLDRYLTAHRTSVHPQSSNLKRYVCVHCSLPCDSKKALTEHLKVHGIHTNILCDLCGKVLSNGEQLKLHKKMHRGDKPFSCNICKKTFTKKFNLQLHERTHTGEKAHSCLKCGKQYSQRSALLRHNARHHTSELRICLKCPKCFKDFASQYRFNLHQKICISQLTFSIVKLENKIR